MECPHCRTGVHESWDSLEHARSKNQRLTASGEPDTDVRLRTMICPECRKVIVQISRVDLLSNERRIAYPWDSSERAAPPEVPNQLRSDYAEATAILNRSPQASAALSRRVVQQVLNDEGGYDRRNLSEQIQDFVEDAANPSHVRDNLDYLREIGNFAAHPMKATNTGEVMPVELGEAEWALEVVDGLFDFYFVGPARDAERRRDFDERLEEAGRRPASGGQ